MTGADKKTKVGEIGRFAAQRGLQHRARLAQVDTEVPGNVGIADLSPHLLE